MDDKKQILLFVDATVRPPAQSRTWQLCSAYLDAFCAKHPDYEVHRLVLSEEHLTPYGFQELEERDSLIRSGKLDAPVFRYAREFAAADHIVIGAPYWDLSFPAKLKIYIENVCVNGIAFAYTETGAKPLCRAGRMTYLTTCGGFMGDMDFGADYMRGLCSALFGIPVFESVAAEALDVEGVDCGLVMDEACERARRIAREAGGSFAPEQDAGRDRRR